MLNEVIPVLESMIRFNFDDFSKLVKQTRIMFVYFDDIILGFFLTQDLFNLGETVQTKLDYISIQFI